MLSFLVHAGAGVACYFMPGAALPPPDPKPVTPVELAVTFVPPQPEVEASETPERPLPPKLELPEVAVPCPPLEFVEPAQDTPEPAPPRVRECRRPLRLESMPEFLTDVTLPEPPVPSPTSLPTAASRPAPAPPAEPARPRPAPAPSQASAAVHSPVPDAENLPPAYPRLAQRRGYEGLVVLLIRVSTEGTCLSVQVLESSGHSVLDRTAVAAVEQWRFRPATADGAAVETEVEVPIRFRLSE